MVFNAVLTRAFERRLPGPGTMTIRIGLRRNVRPQYSAHHTRNLLLSGQRLFECECRVRVLEVLGC